MQMVNKSGKGSKSCKKQLVEDEKLKTSSENDNQCASSSTNEGQKSSLNEGCISEPDFVASTIDQLLSACNDYGLYSHFRNAIEYY